MKKNELISIIIPVYNSEKYINKCINSIINQSYKNIEIILINDGSTDKSGEICDYYSRVDSRIIVKHKKNEGATIARNIGLKNSNGKYVTFVDSDDWIDKDYILNMVNIIIDKNCDLVICNNKEVYITKEEIKYIDRKLDFKGKINICEKLEPNLFINGLVHPCWGKLYRMDLIKNNNLNFTNIKLSEDTVFNLQYLKLCKLIYMLEDSLYFYAHYDNHCSITSKAYEDIFENYLVVHEQFNKYIDRYKDNEYEEVINKTMYAQYYNAIIKVLLAEYMKPKVKKKILNKALNNRIILNTFKTKQDVNKVNFINKIIIKRKYITLIILFKYLLSM